MSHTHTRAFMVLVAGAFPVFNPRYHGAEARELKISHQFTEADARNTLAVEFAKRVEKQTKGELTFKIFPSSALFKAMAQYEAMAKGALDLSVFPLAYASGKIPELEITLMPCIISDVDRRHGVEEQGDREAGGEDLRGQGDEDPHLALVWGGDWEPRKTRGSSSGQPRD